MKLVKNMGSADRIIRPVLAAGMVVAYAIGMVEGIVGIILLVLATIFIITSMFGYCPIYHALHIDTILGKEKKEPVSK